MVQPFYRSAWGSLSVHVQTPSDPHVRISLHQRADLSPAQEQPVPKKLYPSSSSSVAGHIQPHLQRCAAASASISFIQHLRLSFRFCGPSVNSFDPYSAALALLPAAVALLSAAVALYPAAVVLHPADAALL